MQAINVDDEIETIHLYVVRKVEKKPLVLIPLFCAFLCLAAIVVVTIYSAYNPTYEHKTLTIPAHFLPLQTFTTTEPIIPTGIKTYPATTAHGILTLTNGSVVSMQLPAGMIFSSQEAEVITDQAVFVTAGSAEGYGVAMVSAHAISSGSQGNIKPLAINAVYGTSLFIRNLHPFTGGKDAYSVTIETPQDRQTAMETARASLTTQVSRRQAILANPCVESSKENQTLQLSWTCQFIAYPSLPGMKITTVRLQGLNLLVDVLYVARPLSVKIVAQR